MAGVLAGVSDDQFDWPTPCAKSTIGDLVDHIGTFARAFTASARKEREGPGRPPPASAANLEPEWRTRITADLRTLADAWRDPAAWEGMSIAGPFEMPAEAVALVALDELVVHGWDIAVSSGQDYDAPDHEIETSIGFVSQLDAPRDGSLFGPIVPVPKDGPALDRLLGLTGRDPGWKPSA